MKSNAKSDLDYRIDRARLSGVIHSYTPMDNSISKPRTAAPAGGGTPRIENRSDAIKLVESLVKDVTNFHRKNYFLRYGLEALLEAMERKVF